MTMSSAAPLDAIFKEKRALRSRVRTQLKSMGPALRSEEDYAIQRIVLEAPWFKSCKRLCAYISCSALIEVDTSKILSEILKNTVQDDHSQVRKKLYVPRVEDKNSFMRMLNITRMDDLIGNSMDILEPAPCDVEGNEHEDVMLADEPVDLFLLPAHNFVSSNVTIHAFLAKYQELAKDRNWKKPLYVALSYSMQILDDGVDALVSSSRVIPVNPPANDMCTLFLY